jgi:hypothetical protein
MVAVAVLLFVIFGALPVAAVDNPWPKNNGTFIPVANPPVRFNTTPNGTYYYAMLNGSGGMNALHISSSNGTESGQCTKKVASKTGTFYVTDTGGRGYQDNIVLLVAINSTNATDMNNFAINITSSGYQWNRSADGPNQTQAPPLEALSWKNPGVSQIFSSSNYLNNGSSNVFQNWKFAPSPNFPIYCGENMTTGESFKMMSIDLNVGTITNSSYYLTLNNTGMVKVIYNITGPSSFNYKSAKVAFNAYAYNNYTSASSQSINWLNNVNNSAQTGSSYSGWYVTTFP